MKTSFCLALLSLALVSAQAQQASGSQSPQTGAQSVPPPTPYSVVERGVNYRTWQRIVYERDPSGEIVARTHQYREVGTGLNYWNNGQWVDSRQEIDLQPDGTAAATQGRHQAYFPSDINQGTIKVVTPEGLQQQSRPLGLFYDDGQSTVFIAQLQDSTGAVLGTNQVIYTNAFTGVQADLLYTYRIGGFEQDVVLRQQPPPPESYGLNPQNTKLQVMTEFFGDINPVQKPSPVNPRDGLSDTLLAFGSMKMVHGRAFSINDTNANPVKSMMKGAPTYKSWMIMDGRKFLVEAVPYQRITSQLQKLPAPTTASQSANQANPLLNRVTRARMLPPARMVQSGANTVRLAKADTSPNRGLVLDYDEITSDQTNFTFQGDTTYFVDNEYDLYGTSTFEGGTVIKGGQLDIDEDGTVVCNTGPYRPAIFTSMNDDSVGETISGSSGTPHYWDVFCFINVNTTNATFDDMRLNYCSYGIINNNVSMMDFWDCQFMNTDNAISGYNLGLHNVLVLGGLNGSADMSMEGPSLIAENVTFDGVGQLDCIESLCSGAVLATTNCLVTGVSDLVGGGYTYTEITNCTVVIPSPSTPVYQTVGAGNYYLTNNSPYRNAGTTNISPTLLAELAQKTTYPPILYSNVTFDINTTLAPQVQRNTGVPDIGYHYDPIDYLVDEFYVTNASLTVDSGTVIACYNDPGVVIGNESSITSIGTVIAPIWFTRYSAVQEQGIYLGQDLPLSPGNACAVESFYPVNAPNGQISFCKFTCPSSGGYHLYDHRLGFDYTNLVVQDCEFWSGENDFSLNNSDSALLQNNLFARSTIAAASGGYTNCILSLSNNLFWNLTITYRANANSNLWCAFNNSFDNCMIKTNSNTEPVVNGYNAYLDSTNRLYPVNGNDITTNSFDYETGTLGTFYQPNNSPLINAGSCTANLCGLYHFTTTTNQVPETNSVVDIGYHYVATDSDGNPLDSNGDGIPDYIEDANGNGVVDSGEINWQSSTDLGLTVLITTPQNNSVIP